MGFPGAAAAVGERGLVESGRCGGESGGEREMGRVGNVNVKEEDDVVEK